MAANFLDLPVARSSGSARMTGFRAGKCVVEGTRVSPDPRKGRLQICDGDDGLVHVQWMVRGGDETRQLPEEDLIVINDAYLEKIPQCTDGRVYCLRFTSSDKKLLFWMQEPDASRDEARVLEFNRRAGGTPPSAAAPPAAAAATAQPGATNTADRQGSQAHASYDDNLQQLRRLLADYSETLRRARESSAASSSTGVSLGDVLSSQVLRRIGEDPLAVSELTELMPENCRSAEEVRDALRSPQLAAAMRGLTQALYVDPAAILSSMGVSTPSNSLSGTDPVAAFAQALENNFRATDTTSPATATEPNSGPPAAEQGVNGSSMSEAADAQPHASSSSSYTSSSTEQPPEGKKDTSKS